MDFDIKSFLEKSTEKIGDIQRIDIEYEQYDDNRAKLVITASNGIYPAKFDDYHCEPILEFYFGEGFTDETYLESKSVARELRSYIKNNYPNIKVYRSTKCNFSWFEK